MATIAEKTLDANGNVAVRITARSDSNLSEHTVDGNGAPALRVATTNIKNLNEHTVDENGAPALRVICEDGSVGSGGGGAPATKFGVSLDNLLGDVDENGVYIARTELFTVDMTQVKVVDSFEYVSLPSGVTGHCYNTFAYKFCYYGNLVGTIDLSNLEETSLTSGASFEYAFAQTSVDTVYLPKSPTTVLLDYAFTFCKQLTNVYIQSTDLISALQLRYTFQNCSALKNIHGLDKVVSMALYNTFYGTALEGEYRFDSLTTMGASHGAFAKTKITKLYFPALTTFSVNNPFGSSKYNSMIQDCADLVEIHFRADVQATVEALTGYGSKFWGSDALTIYFDL